MAISRRRILLHKHVISVFAEARKRKQNKFSFFSNSELVDR